MTGIELTGKANPSRGYRRFVRTGTGAGLLGGICCVGSAIAAGAGVSGLTFFTTWMNRYQAYIILASVAFMAAWLTRLLRRNGARRGLAASARLIWRQALAMAAAYGLTLLITIGISGLLQGT